MSISTTLHKNLIIATTNNVSLIEVLIMNTLNHAKLAVNDIFYCDEDQAWFADIDPDGEIYLGETLEESFDEAFNLSLASVRCSSCNQFTVLLNDDNKPLCGKCRKSEDD